MFVNAHLERSERLKSSFFVFIHIFLNIYNGRMKSNLRVIFFENKLLLQSDVVFDSESNGRNFSSLAPPGGETKYFIPIFFGSIESFKTPTPTCDVIWKKN